MSNQNKTFILSDESVKNTYNFRVSHAGLNLSRFRNNPVMLADHRHNNSGVIGKWVNLRFEGSQLKAEAAFDLADPEAALIAGKVERGFIKGASLGLFFDPFHLQKANANDVVLEQSEVLEASICAVPSNSNALALYSNNAQDDKSTLALFNTSGKLLDEHTVKKLCLSIANNSASGSGVYLEAVQKGVITPDIFQALSPLVQADFKKNHPEAYKALWVKNTEKEKVDFSDLAYLSVEEFVNLPFEAQLAYKEKNPLGYKAMFDRG